MFAPIPIESFEHIDIDHMVDVLWPRMDKSAFDSIVSEKPPKPFHEWVKGVVLDGRQFTYDRHDYLIQPYQDFHPHIAEMKSTQMGLTSKAMLRCMYGSRYGEYRGILYLFPSKSDVTDFSKGRISALIEDNPEIDSWLKETDAANIKRIWNTFLYLRGMKSRIGLKSVPADFIVYDELDEAPQKAVDMAYERMAHSEQKEQLKLSNPTLPDYGIDKVFQLSDQNYWLIKCDKCNHYTDLVGTFPKKPNDEVPTLIRVKGRVIRACERCHAELNPSNGQWVPKYPDNRDIRGYQYSQLWSHFVSPAEILHIYRTTDNITDLYNLKIGVGYVEAENRLSITDVLRLCGNYRIRSEEESPCTMGVDQNKGIHVVIARKDVIAGKDPILHLGIYKDWEELYPLMDNFHVKRCVVDALPETRPARKFADKFKGRVWLNYYNIHQKGSYAWNEKEFIVSCNRTESMDASHNQIMKGRVILPTKQSDIVNDFAEQLHNVAKKLEEDEQSGSKRYVWIKLGPDHFRHAFNYETMARQFYDPSLMFDPLDLANQPESAV